MNREFLKNAGVPEDAIDKIMAENGKDIQAEKDKAAKTVNDLTEASKMILTCKTQAAELQKKAGEVPDPREKEKERFARSGGF